MIKKIIQQTFNKLSVKLCIFSSILILVIIIAMAHLIMQEARNSLLSDMRVRSDSFVRAVREAFSPKLDLFAMHLQVQEIAKQKSVKYAMVVDQEGKILSHTIAEKIGESDLTSQGIAFRQSSAPMFEKRKENGIEHYYIVEPIILGNKRIATAIIVLNERTINAALSRTRNKTLIILFLGLIFAITGTIIIVNYLIKSIPALTRAAIEIGKGNLNVEIKTRSSDEIGYLSEAFNQMVKGLKERDYIRSIFGKYISKEVVEILLKEKEISLGGEKRKISVLFVDIRDFTKISGKSQPEEIVRFLNKYFSHITKIIHSNNGIVDKYIGDGLLALFGAPMQLKSASIHAINSALQIKKFLESFNRERMDSGEEPVRIGICVTSGTAVVGNIGSEERMEYTAIGEPVNLAVRLEGLNKRLHTEIIVPVNLFEETKEMFNYKNLGSYNIRGWDTPVEVYEVTGENK